MGDLKYNRQYGSSLHTSAVYTKNEFNRFIEWANYQSFKKSYAFYDSVNKYNGFSVTKCSPLGLGDFILYSRCLYDMCFTPELLTQADVEGDNMNSFKKYVAKFHNDVNRFTSPFEDLSYSVLKSKIKGIVGKEIYVRYNILDTYNDNDKGVLLFNKLIPKFSEKYITVEKRIVRNFVSIHKLCEDTFVYVASGIYTPDKQESVLFDNNNDSTYDIYIFIFGKHSNYYYNKINRVLNNIKKSNTEHVLYVINSIDKRNNDITGLRFSNRDIESLVYSHNESKIITDFIDKFNTNIEYYKKKELVHKTGILLYSEPGTGKSSLVKAIACKYKRDICQINIGTLDKINLNELTSMINSETDDLIVLFEDIDTLYLNRDKLSKDGKNYSDIINGLLQFLDSASSPDNVIFIATTNHIDRLDGALIRDGRFDLKLEVKPLEKKDVSRFLKIFEYDGDVEEVLKEYGEPENGLYNQSKLQNIVLKLK